MDTKTFNMHVEDQIERCRKTLIVKGGEYGAQDRLHNFKAFSELAGMSQEQACAGFLGKHIVSIYDMCRESSYGTKYDLEKWNEKIGDAINYLLILSAIVRRKSDLGEYEIPHEYVFGEKPEDETFKLIYRDPLTGAYNRTLLEKLRDCLDDLHIYVAMCDVDNLKGVNDILGHDEGDNQLCLIVKKLEETCPNCYIFRLGGDEFLLLSFEHFLKEIREVKGITFGYSIKKDSERLCEAIKRADEALILSKKIKNAPTTDIWKKANETEVDLDALNILAKEINIPQEILQPNHKHTVDPNLSGYYGYYDKPSANMLRVPSAELGETISNNDDITEVARTGDTVRLINEKETN